MTPATYRLVPTKPQFHDAIWSTTRFDFSRQKGNYVTKEVCLPLYNQNKKTLLKKKRKRGRQDSLNGERFLLFFALR